MKHARSLALLLLAVLLGAASAAVLIPSTLSDGYAAAFATDSDLVISNHGDHPAGSLGQRAKAAEQRVAKALAEGKEQMRMQMTYYFESRGGGALEQQAVHSGTTCLAGFGLVAGLLAGIASLLYFLTGSPN